MASPNPRLRVAIVGGGIGGQLFAIALASFGDIEIDIYEGASKFEEIGAGLAIWGESVTICQRLGILDRLMAISPGTQHPTYIQLRRANVPEGNHFGNMIFSRAMGLHRAQLLDVLVQIREETGRAKTHFSKRCVSFSQAEGGEEVTIYFKDGTTATCDCLIGCDGIRSVVRKQLIEELGWSAQDPDVDSSGLRFTRTVAYRALVNPEHLGDHPARKYLRTYCGSHKHLVTYPVAGGKFINLLGYSTNPDRYEEWKNGPWTLDEEGSEILKEFNDFETEVRVMLQAVERTSRWCLYEVSPLPHWSKGCVALLGDAAHAMPPCVASGGGQVVEDCYMLAQLLGDPTVSRKDIPHALRSYELIRKKRSEKVLDCTGKAKSAFEGLDEYATASDERIDQAINELVGWMWEGKLDLDEELVRGKRELERLRG